MLNLRSLRHLVVLSRHLNFVRAAEELGIAQPSLSRSIQSLERQLGVALFDRTRGGGVRLTSQGHTVAERAQFLLTDAEDLERQSKLYDRGESGRIRFGMAPMPAYALLSQTLARRLKAAPGVVNEVVVRDVEALWSMLRGGDIEFFVCPNRPVHNLSGVHIELLATFPLSLLVRAGHPLLDGIAAGARFPFARSSWTGISAPAETEKYILGDPNIVEDFATLAGVTRSTDTIWLSSASAVQDDIANGSLVELFRAEQTLDLELFALRRRLRSPLAQMVANDLRELALRAAAR